MTNKDIEKLFAECDGLDMSHVKKDDILAKAKQEMYFATEPEEQKEEKSSFPLFFTKKRFVPLMAGVALAFMICVGGIGVYAENYQTVYIDINPSVALKLNRFERVIGVEYLNEDAATLLADTKLVGCDATVALENVIAACNSAGYVKDDSEIYISATAKKEEDSEKILKKLKGRAENMREEEDETYSVSTYSAKKGEKKEIEKESISPAKYNVIKDIIDEDECYKMEDLKDKSMEELRKIKHRQDKDDDDFDDDRDDDRDDERDDDDDDDDDDRNEHNNGNQNNNGATPTKKPENKPEDKPNGNDKPHGPEDKDDDDREDEDDDREDDDEKDNHKKQKD